MAVTLHTWADIRRASPKDEAGMAELARIETELDRQGIAHQRARGGFGHEIVQVPLAHAKAGVQIAYTVVTGLTTPPLDWRSDGGRVFG